jgi:hypothetical protein
MTEPTSNAHAAIESDLVCPRRGCHAANRPGTTYIAADLRAGTAGCIVCSFEGPLALFQPKPLPEGEH